MKKLLTLLLVVAVLAGAFVTNPSKERHQEVIRAAVEEASAEYVSNHTSDTMERLLGGLLSGIATSVINTAINAQLHYHNYYLFSTCTMKVEGAQKVVSLGLFNQIVTMDKDDVLKALGEEADDNGSGEEAADTEG